MMFLRYVCVVMIGICSPYLSTQVKELKGKTAGKVVEYVRLVRKKRHNSQVECMCTSVHDMYWLSSRSSGSSSAHVQHALYALFFFCTGIHYCINETAESAKGVVLCVCVCVCKWCTGHCDIVHHSDTGAGAPLPQEVGGGLQPPCLLEGVWLGMWCGRSLTAQWCTLCVLLRHSRVPTSTPPPPAPAHACSGQVCSTQLCVTHGYAPHAST